MVCGAGGCLSAAGPVPGSILSGHCKGAWLGAVTQPGLKSLLLLCPLFQNSSSGEIQGIFSTKCRHWLIQAPEHFVASGC